MKKPTVIGLDFHGAVFDHRISKYFYFKTELGLDYKNPYLERKEIVRELDISEVCYLTHLENFLESDYALSGEFVTGFEKFLDKAPDHWRFIIMSGTKAGAEKVKQVLHFQNLNRISGVYCMARDLKPALALAIGTAIYFDDRDDLFEEMTTHNIKVVQISPPANVQPSPKANLYFKDWMDALGSIDEIMTQLKQP